MNAAAEPLFDRVVFGVDFASSSLAAARWATKYVARRTHALLSHVVPFPELLRGEDDSGDTLRGERGPMLSALKGALGGFAVTLDLATSLAVLRIGRPSWWLSSIANQAQASLVVLGRRRRVARDWFGEPLVAERIAKQTSAPLLMVPEGTKESPARVIALVEASSDEGTIGNVAESLSRINNCALELAVALPSDVSGSIIVAARHRYDLLSSSNVPVLLLAP